MMKMVTLEQQAKISAIAWMKLVQVVTFHAPSVIQISVDMNAE